MTGRLTILVATAAVMMTAPLAHAAEGFPAAQHPRQPFTLAQSVNPSTVDPRGDVTYSVTVSNSDDASVKLNSLTDTLAPGFSYRPGTTTGDSEPSVAQDKLTFAGMTVPAHNSRTITFGARAAAAPGDYTNSAQATADDFSVSGTGPGAPVAVRRLALTMSQEVAPTTVDPSGDVTYTLSVQNPNSVDVELNSLTDTLAPGFSYRPGTTTGDSEPSVAQDKLTFAGMTVPAHNSRTITFGATAAAAPGDYTNSAAATADDFSVSGTGPGATVTVSQPLPPPAPSGKAPEPQSEPAPPSGELPPPTNGKTFNLDPNAGTVLVNGKRVTEPVQIQNGEVVDTTKGSATLFSAAPDGEVQSADFHDGLFKVGQQPGDAVTDLSLQGGDFKRTCPATAKRASAAGSKPVRQLWGSGHGKFRTGGKGSSASVRGTIWLVQDGCKGTVTKVFRGVVDVRDYAKKRTVTVNAGQSYLARY